MVPMFVEFLPKTEDDDPDRLSKLMFDDIMQLNGKQTIYQMIQFAERIKERGGQPKEPLWYKHEYLRRLELRIKARKDRIREGKDPIQDSLVFNTLELLDHLQARNLKLILASGTDEQYVKEEAALLGLSPYFGDQIYGAKDDYKTFSKKMVIDRLLAENQIRGEHLLAFGDGYVEIENTKSVGGLAVAVASDEANNGSGEFDSWKRDRLMGVGADLVIPDYRDAAPLLQRIMNR